ncbi:M-phase phosphoprotein 9-like [Alligator mississippiensis]|uniref:M-phase phosphoprotein 9-like n=1 Tax=Alligator mississippiensis TaxID=8496 RepID=A0A151NSA7_ALLMI|nr:M-phase phosphoprotein 9-like [Alligator mississippiensis]
MENLDLVKIVQESPPSSVESGIRNTHNTGCNLNTNSRSSPLSNPNGVSSFSGKTSPSVIPGSVEVLASFMQDIQKTGRTDSEILQNCETRWLQLFKLVEKQCQEQIVAQQEQFHHQIQLVQNEIWQLLKLQNSNVSWDSSNCRSSPAKFTNNFSSLESQMGLRSETLQENEPIVNQLKSNEAESQPKASAVHQECFANTISMNSAYDDILVFPAEFEHKFNEDQCGKTNCKSLTSWAQKLKQSQSKKTNVEEEGHVNSMQQNEQGKKLTFETINLTDAASPSYAFYLSQPNESPSSLTSEASGLTYWKLDEKELYHPLPENFRNEFSNIFSTKLSSDQLSSGEEMKPSSLKDIYHKKQRENKQLPEWNRISPSQPSHPPEVLTLDPTLHMRPDPVVLSKIRQNLREKHARHIADLRAYYDSEIHSLKQQLEASHKTASSEDLKKINQNLVDRCDQLDAALNEASARMRALENKNNMLEKQVTDWRERFYAASNTSKVLQERIEEMRTSNKDKDNTISRLKSRLKDLEEAFEKAYKLSDNKDTRLKEENKMFQDLLGEYESLGKEHERVKDTLNATENRLLDANTQISDLKRTISKLEVQLKQVEHENMLKFRHITESHLRTSHVNSKLATPDVSRRKWLIPGAEYSIFTGQPLESQETKDNRLEETYIPSRHHSPPEKDSSQEDSSANVIGKKENEAPETPIMKAFKELEERKAFKDWTTQTEKDNTSAKTSNRRQTVGFDETTFITSRSPEKCKDQQRPKRYSSPSGQRSSSLPPSNRKSNTPTRREIMLAPVSVTYSPKRSPKENLSPGFSHLLSKNENTVTRFDILLDDLDLAPASTPQHSNPRKRLQFLSLDDIEGRQHSGKGINSCVNYNSCAESLHPGTKKGTVESAWEERNITHKNEQCVPVPVAPYEADFKYTARIKTLAETERLFDELTQEKQQIEAALSRIPCAGGRMTLQTRLNQEALENRLERINRDLGSIRMTLKRFHVLRTSANI